MLFTADMYHSFLASRSDDLSAGTMRHYRNTLSLLIGTELDVTELRQWVAGILMRYRLLSVLCGWLELEGHTPTNLIRRVPTPHESGREQPVVRENMLPRLIDWAKQSQHPVRNELIIRLLSTTGMRSAELVSLRVADVCLATQRIRLRVKGGRMEQAIITPGVAGILPRYMNGGVMLFDISLRDVGRMFEDASEYLGVKVTPHAFRRGYACDLAAKGLSTRRYVWVVGGVRLQWWTSTQSQCN